MADYRVTVVDPSGRIGSDVTWKRYKSETLSSTATRSSSSPSLPEPGSIRARVTDVDNDAFFTNKVTVEPIGTAEEHES